MSIPVVESLDQREVWVDAHDVPHQLSDMLFHERQQVAERLRSNAFLLAVSYTASHPGEPDRAFRLTNPEMWLNSMPLMRALRGEDE